MNCESPWIMFFKEAKQELNHKTLKMKPSLSWLSLRWEQFITSQRSEVIYSSSSNNSTIFGRIQRVHCLCHSLKMFLWSDSFWNSLLSLFFPQDDNSFLFLAENLRVPKNLYERIAEIADYKKYTSALLMILFDRETLATHSLQGRRNTFTGDDCHKPQLPPEILRNIIGKLQNIWPSLTQFRSDF